jgi:Spy/CpxP family protein refolding chaperone
MKKQLCLLAVSALIGIGAAIGAPQDQNSAPPPAGDHGAHHQMDPSRRVKTLAKKLNLSEDQQKQLLPIFTDEQQQFEAIHNDGSLAPKDRREKMRSVREASETKIKAVLTDSQKQTYDQMQQQMREKMQQRRNQGQDSNSGSGSN